MFLNVSHPQFNRDLEVLCCIPPSPATVPVRTIADDCGTSVDAVLAILRRHGVRYFQGRGPDEYHTNFLIPQWRRRREQLESYWSTVNPGESS